MKIFLFILLQLVCGGLQEIIITYINNLEKGDNKYYDVLDKTNKFFNKTFNRILKKKKTNILEEYEHYVNLTEHLKNNLTKNKLATFCLNIVIGTQLSHSSIFLLNCNKTKK